MRDIDRVSRWGGEEFVVLLPGAGFAQAHEVAERLRERVQALPPRWQERAVPLTVSAGVSDVYFRKSMKSHLSVMLVFTFTITAGRTSWWSHSRK